MNTNNSEIEKTYLAKNIPSEYLKGKSKHITDLYISDDIRIRNIDGICEFTKKIEINGQLERQEINVPLTNEEYNLLTKASLIKLDKTRHYYKYDEFMLEIDVWEGKYSGMITVEVEFNSEISAQNFTPPPFCLKEVTSDSYGSIYKSMNHWKKYYK